MTPIAVACEPPPLEPGRMLRMLLIAIANVPAWGMLLFVAAAVVAGLVAGPRQRVHGHSASKVEVAKLVVTKYANEAYPAWAADHPTRACPVSLSELAPYMDPAGSRDPWGRHYAFTCADAKLYAMSLGEDGRSNTDDDIWSHE